MRFLIGSVIALLSSAAMAFPAQGDYVRFELLEAASTGVYSGLFEEELTNLDSSANTYVQLDTMTLAGMAPTVNSSAGVTSDLMSPEKVTAILQNCGGNGGTLTPLSTEIGVFQTCAVPVSNADEVGTFWIGMVPFGIVQADLVLTNATHVQLFINSYREGQK